VVPSSTTTTVPPTTTTVPAASCPGDTSAPTGTFTLAGGGSAEIGYTAAANVTLTLSFDDLCTPILAQFSNGGAGFGADVEYDPTNRTVSWSLASGDGTKTVHGQVRDAIGNARSLTVQSIVLDATKPTVPGTLTRLVSCSGANRTVTLQWGYSTDTNFRGFRVYRSTDGTTWSALGTVSALTTVETHKKNLDTVRYHVVGYDKAGNESNGTNIVSLAKNQCS
jgi:hypothetical protein